MESIINTVQYGSDDYNKFLQVISDRVQSVNTEVESQVKSIIKNVRISKDSALFNYTCKFDKVDLSNLKVNEEDIKSAYDACDQQFKNALQNAYKNIYTYHEKQRKNGYELTVGTGSKLGQIVRGLNSVGLYVPGGTAAYSSTVLMNAIPAIIAGVKNIIMITPPDKSGNANKDILCAAYICGIKDIFLVGGAHGVAALAYGTQTVPRVDKIVGPGNIYVATAKKLLYGVVDIDMIAGPSEILIIADEHANPRYLAADLLSQAEHDRLASCILVTTSKIIAQSTSIELEVQTKKLSRSDIVRESLKNYGGIIICDNLIQAMHISNHIAPEHLELCVQKPDELLDSIENAGSVFMGNYSPEPLGDYYAGTNHVLPTSGTARFFSPLSVDDFVKKMSYTYYNKADLLASAEEIILMARREGLDAHAAAIETRL